MTSRDDFIDIPERRSVPIAEFDVKEKNGIAHVEGYASVFDKGYDILGGPDSGVGWTEYVNQNAFKRTLSENPDVVVLENHVGGPLARTKSGTLSLATDTTGLIPRFDLDLRDPQAKSVFIKLDRKDYDEMSFAFRVRKNTWTENDTVRSLDEVSLHKGDVSIVNFGANPFTSVGLRSAVKMLAREDWSDEEIAELRAMSDQVNLAMQRLETARADDKPGDEAPALRESITVRSDSNTLLAGLDATLDEAAKLTEDVDRSTVPEEVGQALDLLVAAQESVGQIMKLLGIYDPDDPEKNMQEILNIVRRALDDDGIQGPDNDDGGGDSLARAVHDLIADAAGCVAAPGLTKIPSTLPYPRNLTVVDAQRASAREGNLTLDAVYRMCRPEDSPEPLTLAEAEQLAS